MGLLELEDRGYVEYRTLLSGTSMRILGSTPKSPVGLTPSPKHHFAAPEDTIAQLVRALNAYDADAVYETFSSPLKREQSREQLAKSAVIFTSRETCEGTGTANIEIEGPGSSSFSRGIYDTIIWFGPMRYVTAGWEWVIGD